MTKVLKNAQSYIAFFNKDLKTIATFFRIVNTSSVYDFNGELIIVLDSVGIDLNLYLIFSRSTEAILRDLIARMRRTIEKLNRIQEIPSP